MGVLVPFHTNTPLTNGTKASDYKASSFIGCIAFGYAGSLKSLLFSFFLISISRAKERRIRMFSLEPTAHLSAALLTLTTCVLLIYLVLFLTHLMTTRTFRFHKKFWISIVVSYGLALLVMMWPLLLMMLCVGVAIFIVKKVKTS